VRRNRLEGKSLHEGQEDGLGTFGPNCSLTSIDICDLEILCKGARHDFPRDMAYSRLTAHQWKGYQDTDNTYARQTLGARQTRYSRTLYSWEPFKSFENCGEEIVERFWDRVDTKGRDVDSIEGWTNGEEVHPIGPPRTLSYLKHHTQNLLSVEAERAG
jgi:hypothetical protein